MTKHDTGAVTVALGLGSNIGDRKAFLVRALDELAAHPSIAIVAVSPIYETPPWGKTDQPAFLNSAALMRTDIAPHRLLNAILDCERALGRERTDRWGPRTIDIDILLYGDSQVDEPGLTIPHPRIRERAFVLCPLADLLPDANICGRTISDWRNAQDLSGIRKIDGRGWYPTSDNKL